MQSRGLKRNSFDPQPDRRLYYAFDAFEQRLKLFRGLVSSRDELILVIGEQGSGKTTFLEQFLNTSSLKWQKCRFRLGPARCKVTPKIAHSQNCPAYILHDKHHRTVILDDAHLVEPAGLEVLLKKLGGVSVSGEVDRLVLFGDPSINAKLMDCLTEVCDTLAISRVYLPVLTQAETTEYLRHRLSIAGASGYRLYSRRVAKRIYRSTGGLPGRINNEAELLLQKNTKKVPSLPSGDKPSRVDKLRALLSDVSAVGERLTAGTLFQPSQFENNSKNQVNTSSINMATDPGNLPGRDPKSAGHQNGNAMAKLLKTDGTGPSLSSKPFSSDQTGNVEHSIHREEWLLCQDPACFTIQVLGVKSESALAAIVKTHKSLPHRQLACFRTLYKGEGAYPLLWGIYRTRSEASIALDELPDRLKEFFPLIRRISAIQKSIRSNEPN